MVSFELSWLLDYSDGVNEPVRMKRSSADQKSGSVALAVNVRIRSTVESLLDATAPLYQPDRRAQPSLIGSGVFVSVANKRFLLTAAHVFDNAAPQFSVSVGTTTRIVSLPGSRWRTKGSLPDGVDREDMAIVPLGAATDDEYRGCRFLGLHELDPYQESDEVAFRAPYLVIGYPRTAQPRQVDNGKLAPVPRAFITHAFPFSKYADLNAQPASHLVIGYDRQDFFDFGISKQQPDPHGMSGGGVWRLDDLWSSGPLSARLVAVLCEYHVRQDHVILATRVCSPLEGIRTKCPNLRPVIDAHFGDPTETIEIAGEPGGSGTGETS